MRTKRRFGEAEQRAFLEQAAILRRVCIAAMARAPINAPFYRALEGLVAAIDALAETVTGDPRHFSRKPHSIP